MNTFDFLNKRLGDGKIVATRVEINNDVGDRVKDRGNGRFSCSRDPKKAISFFFFELVLKNFDLSFGFEIAKVCFTKNNGERGGE